MTYACTMSGVSRGSASSKMAETITLRVEGEMVRTRLASGDGFECPLHAANRDRVAALLDRHGRRHEVRFLHDDVSEAWAWLSVQPGES